MSILINNEGKWNFHGGSNPLPVAFTYGAKVGPHVSTSRKSYTVPTGKCGILVSAFLSIQRATLGSVAGDVNADLRITPSGSSEIKVLDLYLSSVGQLFDVAANLPCRFPLSPGDKVEAFTIDGGTGGTVGFNINAAIIQFDPPRVPG